MADNKALVLKHDIQEQTEELTDAQFGKLVRSLLKYDESGIEPGKDSGIRQLFKMLKAQVDTNKQKYAKTCEERKKAAQKRWNTSEPVVSDDMQLHANACNSMQENANDANIKLNNKSLLVNDFKPVKHNTREGDITQSLKNKFQDFYDCHPNNEFTVVADEVIAVMADSYRQSQTAEGLKFNKKTYHCDQFWRILQNMSVDDFCNIIPTVRFRDDIQNRPLYILGCVFNKATIPKKTKESDTS